jgi:hypothetical protein
VSEALHSHSKKKPLDDPRRSDLCFITEFQPNYEVDVPGVAIVAKVRSLFNRNKPSSASANVVGGVTKADAWMIRCVLHQNHGNGLLIQ